MAEIKQFFLDKAGLEQYDALIKQHIDNHHGEASKLEHSLTIGDKIFDGTKDVVIAVYDGSMEPVDDSVPMTYSMQPTNAEQDNMTLIAEDTKMIQMDNNATTNLQMN